MWWLAGILALAAVLRIWGVRFGLPGALLHLDEPPIVLRAQQILRGGDWNPHWFHYPSLFLYLQVILQAAGRMSDSATGFLAARLTSVAAGLVTIGLTYAVGERFSSRPAALFGALFLAVSFLHARECHFATVDATATLWVTASLYFSVLAVGRGSRSPLLAAAVFAGLAAGTKYNAGLVLAAPLAALFLCGVRGRRAGWAVGLAGLAAAAFLVVTPYAVLDSSTFFKDVLFEARHYREGHFGFESDWNALYFLGYLFSPGMGEGLLLFAGLGFVLAIRSRDRSRVPVLLFLLLYYVSISIVRVNFVRNLLPVLPVLCLLAGSGVDFILVRLPLRGTIRVLAAAVVVAALVALPLTRTVTYDRAIANSTRLAAGQWIRTHLPQGSKLATEIYGPEPIRGWQSVTVVIHLSDHAPEWYESNGFDYIVASSGAYEMAYSNPSRYREAVERYEEIFSRFPRVAEFKGETVDPRYSSICPTILILAVPGRGRTATAPAGEIP